MRFLFFCFAAVLISSKIMSQDCEVLNPDLKGKYNGECKKGKANGKGKAEGKDLYDGDFSAGLAEGKGTYTWNNGNSFTGQWSKGLKEGKGTMKFKLPSGADSLVEGYWKKDVYIGKYEKPYAIYHKSRAIGEIEIEYEKNGYNLITFFITNTSGGASRVDEEEMPRMKVDEVQAISGTTGRLTWNEVHAKKTESVIADITFPSRLKITIGSEELDIEFREAFTYKIRITINL